MMEISKGLQQEIQLVQSKLKNAIRDHQICVGKLKDDPNNTDILERIQDIQLHIVSLGRCQKQVVQRLRKEVDDFKAANANEVKVSVAALLGLNNNNHITANNESTNDDVTEVKVVTNGLDNARLTPAKEDYEEVVRNGDVTASPQENNLNKERSVSVETLSADDEEIIEVSVNEDRRENKRQMSEEPLAERRIKCTEQLTFLEVLGLITTLKSTELQNRRAERKRRSTANPQFIYSNWEMPMKRKRHNYLQSAGNVPQTRQTTARLNGPSPPPICNKSATSIVPPKSTSPPSQKISKSLIPTQKATTRPNILRNMSESRVYPCKSSRIENGNGQLQLSTSSTRTTQSTPNSKTVLIPGLPSGLTIERIESDSAVCINCRNPGTLTTCDNCEANYHVSCHSISPPPPRLCPKCALRMSETTPTIKKNDELAAASYAPGVAGKAGEDPEVNKASGGFHKVGTNAKQQQQQTIVAAGGRGVNKLSTILIPISTNAIATTVDAVQSGLIIANESTLNVVEPNGNSDNTVTTSGTSSYSTSIIIGKQLSRSSVTYVSQSDDKNVPYAYELPIVDTKSTIKQPLFYVKKIPPPGNETSVEQRQAREEQSQIGNDANVRFIETRNDLTITDCSKLDKLTGSFADTISRGWKKSTTRAIPALTRIVKQSDDSTTVASEHGDDDDMDELQSCSYNSRGSANRDRHEARSDGTAHRNECEITERADKFDKVEGGRKSENQSESLFSRAKCRSKSGGILHSLFAGYNKPDNVADCIDDARKSTASTIDGNGPNDESELERDKPAGDRSQCSAEHVKLEEAHLSAPLRAKLIAKKESNDKALIEREFPSNLQNSTREFPSRRRTTDDCAGTSSLFRGNVEGKQERRQLPRILMRAARRSLESRENNEIEMENLKVVSFERKYSNSFVRLPNKMKKLPDEESNNDSDTSATDDATSPVSMLEKKSDINLDDDDDDDDDGDDDKENGNSEKQDLSEENGPNLDSGGDLQIDEETDDNEEEIDDVEDQDCPIVDEEMKNETSKGFRIGTVSPESMRVLEQFESAMLQVDSGDKTANP